MLQFDKPLTVVDFLEDLVAEAFLDENERRQEHRDPTALSMSGLGGCTKRNAYSVAGIEATDTPPPEEARMALLGSGAHDWLLPAIARVIRRRYDVISQVEHSVVLRAAGIEIPGNLDLAVSDLVIDLKTVREWKLNGVRRAGAYNEHRVQVLGYAFARHQAGQPVRWVSYLYLDRATGEVQPVVEPFDVAAVEAVLRRIETIVRFAEENPDAAPREGRGPGVSLICDRCPWLRRCWGADARPGRTGVQPAAANNAAALVQILALYANAAAASTAAGKDKDFAKLVLSRTDAGIYGPWKLGRGKDGETDDTEAMKAILAELGIDVPKKRRAGAIRIGSAATRKEGTRR